MIGSLNIHEDKLKDQSTKRKENALLARTFGKTKKKDDNSRGRGRG